MEERFALDMAGACAAISSRQPRPSVLVVHGAADPICEASDAAKLAGSIQGEGGVPANTVWCVQCLQFFVGHG